MSTAKRRINSTGRSRITRNHVDIRMLATEPGEPLRATMKLDLDGLPLPPSGAVVVEAYHRSSGIRIECGTVGNMRVPDVLKLDELDRSGSPLFRVKVVEQDGQRGKILAAAERLRPLSDDEDAGRRSIFPIRHADLGPELWAVSVDDGGPVLYLNNRVAGITERLLQSPLLQGILLPAAFRHVLRELAADPAEDDEEESPWKEGWLRFCSAELDVAGDPSDMNPDEIREWIDECVRKFCERHDFIERVKAMMAMEQDNG